VPNYFVAAAAAVSAAAVSAAAVSTGAGAGSSITGAAESDTSEVLDLQLVKAKAPTKATATRDKTTFFMSVRFLIKCIT
jgi:hypothetical protein